MNREYEVGTIQAVFGGEGLPPNWQAIAAAGREVARQRFWWKGKERVNEGLGLLF